ncbi:hypothetical protein J6TS1_15560 [Siminovitchia terrae]|uniref:Uncharacterized protein n=1 Tax=Siminovitchia terrae TaxID=1914933 RepID=A0ABQ4KUF9_SIMTE|nr:hypothetical protein [Siminovitchia terrae]GIN91596.1 hypothetical protein J22TS1_26470 [Siminovitchia terrae]GIN95686.1 hypothetical protein J6TS1_15560 [Siminovitchia terrae]
MNRIVYIVISFVLIVFFSGCNQSKTPSNNTSQQKDQSAPQSSSEESSEDEDTVYDKEEIKSEGLDTIEDVISSFNRVMHEGADPKYVEEGFDDGYHYYLESLALNRALNDVEINEDLEKDTNNLKKLSQIIKQEHFKRTDSSDSDTQSHTEWDEPSEVMDQAVLYTQHILQDLDSSINNSGDQVQGYSHLLNGDKKSEVDKFTSKYADK